MAAPCGALTLTGPVFVPLGTVAEISLSETTVKVAGVRSKVTLVAPVKLYPVIATAVPADPLVGEKPVTSGFTMKLVELDALPKVFVKVIGPLVAPAGTTTASWVLEIPLKFGVAVPLRETALVPVKFVPVSVTVVPTTPLAGEKELTVGVAVETTVKLVELIP